MVVIAYKFAKFVFVHFKRTFNSHLEFGKRKNNFSVQKYHRYVELCTIMYGIHLYARSGIAGFLGGGGARK